MTTPTYLPNTDSNSSWGSAVEVRLRSTTSTHAIYGAWNPSTSDWYESTAVHSIRVGIVSSNTSEYNVWVDNLPVGNNDPSVITESTVNGIVYVNLWQTSTSTNKTYQFVKPTASTASWLSSGSTTTTEEVEVACDCVAGQKKVHCNFW